MGRIKTMLVKRTTVKLFREYGEHFTSDFAKNKHIVAKLITTQSKKILNTITGYATRMASGKRSYKTL